MLPEIVILLNAALLPVAPAWMDWLELEKELPCMLIGHWPCFYVNDGPGFKVLKEVKRRLDAYDPDRAKTLWMKTSEIGHYWMARTLSDIHVEAGATPDTERLRIETKFPTHNFTLSLDVAAKRIKVGGSEPRPARSRRDFHAGTFLVEGGRTFVAFDLPTGATTVTVWRDS